FEIDAHADDSELCASPISTQVLIEPFGLTDRPWKTIQDEPVFRIRPSKASGNHLHHDFVGHKAPRFHDLFRSSAQLRPACHIGAEYVASGNLRNLPKICQGVRLRAFSCARRTKQEHWALGSESGSSEACLGNEHVKLCVCFL